MLSLQSTYGNRVNMHNVTQWALRKNCKGVLLWRRVFKKELERKVDELAAENRELLTFVDESVRIAEEFKQKAFLMGESLEKDAQMIYARALYGKIHWTKSILIDLI